MKFVSNEWIDTCKEYFPTEEYVSCTNLVSGVDSICETLQPLWDWSKGAVIPIISGSKWVWDETGKAYGPPGQLFLIASLALLTFNLCGSNRNDVKAVHKREVYRLVDRRIHNLQMDKKILRNAR